MCTRVVALSIITLAIIGCTKHPAPPAPLQPALTERPTMFPQYDPVPDADPSNPHSIDVRVPTKLKFGRMERSITIEIDRDSLEPARIMVGDKMVTGVDMKLYVHRLGEPRQQPLSEGRSSGVDFKLGTDFLNPSDPNYPAPGDKLQIEADLAIFETDVPSQHMWMPESPKYKVIWQRTIKRVWP